MSHLAIRMAHVAIVAIYRFYTNETTLINTEQLFVYARSLLLALLGKIASAICTVSDGACGV